MGKMGKGKLTTHVLDTSSGRPAAGMKITLYKAKGKTLEKVKSLVTNADGRCDEPVLSGAQMKKGTYELHFDAGTYLKEQGLDLPVPAFLDVVPIRFGIADADSHYHVPLLVSAYGYSTYRGS